MRYEDFDLISTVFDRISEFTEKNGSPPSCIILSPQAFHWLRTIYDEELAVLGSSALDTVNWTLSVDSMAVPVAIDEMADDFDVRLI